MYIELKGSLALGRKTCAKLTPSVLCMGWIQALEGWVLSPLVYCVYIAFSCSLTPVLFLLRVQGDVLSSKEALSHVYIQDVSLLAAEVKREM